MRVWSVKRATQIKLMEVQHEGQRQAEERLEMFQQMLAFPQQQQQFAPIQPQRLSYLPSSTSWQYPPRMVSQSHQCPPSSQWSTQQMPGQQPTSVWGSQDYNYMSSQYLALYPDLSDVWHPHWRGSLLQVAVEHRPSEVHVSRPLYEVVLFILVAHLIGCNHHPMPQQVVQHHSSLHQISDVLYLLFQCVQ
ncbi:hypothetical protein DPMN_193939 [Dreissena polymorpha]|uniref:Uncharacterized protein n=1 Tax=Dreissena polymorpha TaxID=45954 RepID=A0A9D3Y1C1_DREPO|nr:hypothetical protein DPMN_193939 [Dreissena polymorpha]